MSGGGGQGRAKGRGGDGEAAARRGVFRGGSVLRLPAPGDYDLGRDVCSYGYFLLAPNRWVPAERALYRSLEVASGPIAVRVTQVGVGGPLSVACSRRVDRAESAEVRAMLGRVLDLGVSADDAAAFHAADPRWQASGRARLFRSPTLFEDVIKTVTSCNVAWPSTMRMNERMCAVLGKPVGDAGVVRALGVAGKTFPSATRLGRTREGTLRSRCVVGYRDRRIVELSKGFARGWFDVKKGKVERRIEVASIEDRARPYDEVYSDLLLLPGIGPYAAANVMQLLGRYDRVPIDTETVRHGRVVLGMEGEERVLMKRLAGHYAGYGAEAFRSYWFELWSFYESKRGPAETWERETTGRTFTAAALRG